MSIAPGGGQTAEEPSGWTTDTLMLHVTAMLSALRAQLDERHVAQQDAMRTAFLAADQAVQAALQSAEKAVNKAEAAAVVRFESVNEFRGQLNDQAATFLPRAEAEARFTALSGMLHQFMRDTANQLQAINQRLDQTRGRDQGFHTGWGYLVGGVGLVAVLVGLFFAFAPGA